MKSPTEWLEILIFNYPSAKLSVKRPNKKPRIHNFTTDKASFFFFFPICKKTSISISFSSLLFSPELLLFSFMLRYVFFSFLLFSSHFFLINILYKFIYFSLLSFTCNHIKVRFFFFSFFLLFFHYICVFILFLIVFVLNNCMNIVVGFFFSYDFLLLFSKRFEYYRVLIYINLIIL